MDGRQAGGNDPLQAILAQERLEALARTLALYPQGLAMLALKMEHGYTITELAAQRGVSTNTVWRMFNRLSTLVVDRHPEYQYHAAQGCRNRGAGKNQRRRRLEGR